MALDTRRLGIDRSKRVTLNKLTLHNDLVLFNMVTADDTVFADTRIDCRLGRSDLLLTLTGIPTSVPTPGTGKALTEYASDLQEDQLKLYGITPGSRLFPTPQDIDRKICWGRH